MPVHTISTDLHRGNVERYAVSLSRTMTKLLALGMPWLEVVRGVTLNAARAVGLDALGYGTIREGGRVFQFTGKTRVVLYAASGPAG